MDRVSLIYKVLSGEASAAERMEMDEWVAETPGNKEEFEDIKLFWATANQADGENWPLFEDGFDKIKARIRADVRRRRWVNAVGKMVAIVVFGLGVFFLLHNVEAWFPGAQTFEFKDVALEQAIGVIEDRYHIRIEVEDPELLRRQVTLVVYEVNNAQDIVEALAQALNAEATALSGKRYRLTEAGGNSKALKPRE